MIQNYDLCSRNPFFGVNETVSSPRQSNQIQILQSPFSNLLFRQCTEVPIDLLAVAYLKDQHKNLFLAHAVDDAVIT